MTLTVANRDYHHLSHSEIDGGKRIYQHLSGHTRPGPSKKLVSGYATYQDLGRHRVEGLFEFGEKYRRSFILSRQNSALRTAPTNSSMRESSPQLFLEIRRRFATYLGQGRPPEVLGTSSRPIPLLFPE